MESLTISQLARRADVNVETVRYYERRGLIPPPPRRPSRYRQFPPEAVIRLRFIRRAQEVGFTLKEIKELLSLQVTRGTTCENIRTRAEGKIGEIERRINKLKDMKRALVALQAACKGRGPTSDCPILEAFERNCCSNR